MKEHPLYKQTVSISLLLCFFCSEIGYAAGITIGAGASVTQSGAAKISTNGDWDNNGTFNAGAGTVELNGASSTTLEAGVSSFNNLVLNKTDAADANDNLTVQTDNLSVTGALTVTDGELIQGLTNITLAGLTVAAAGKYSNSSTGDLTMSGAVSSAGTIAFDANGGGAGSADDILIRSSVLGTQRNWQGAGTFSMTDVDVKDQTALGGTPAAITVSSGTNSGNNINWLFGAVTISGTAYSSKTEAATLNLKNLTIVQFRGGITTTYTTTTGVAGTFSVTMTDAQSGDPMVVFLNDEAEEGNLVYISDGLNVTNLKLYQNEVALRNDSGTGVTNTNLANIDNGDDDIKYNVAAGTATFESAFELFIFTGSTYAPGGNAVFQDIDLNGTFTMGANSITCSGVWDATGGAYSSTGTVTFTATAAKSLTSNGDSALASFNHVVFNGLLGQWNLQDNLDVDGNLTMTNGTLNANGLNINSAGNWTNNATFTSGAGTVFFDGASTQVLTSTGTGTAADDTGIDFNNLTVSGATLQLASGSELEVDGTLTVNAAKTLDLNAATLDLNGTLQNLGVVALEGSETLAFGAWDTDSGTTRFTGDTVTIPAAFTAFFNLDIDEIVDGQTYTLPDNAITVNGVLSVTDGILAFDDDKSLALNDNGSTGTALSLAVAGTLTNSGTGDLTLRAGVSNAGTITFNSSDDAGNGISILSNSSPTQRNWQGAGTFNMTDVTVKDQTAIGGAPASITAISSTNNGNNVNWLFAGGVLSTVSVTPASLVSGSTSNNTVVFTTTSAIPSNGKIRVTFPAGFNVAGVTTATSTSDLDGTLTVTVSGQDVTITRSGGTNFSAGGTVDDLVIPGVVNPAAPGLTGTFAVATLDASSTIIDSGTGSGVTIVVGGTASTAKLINSLGVVTPTFTLGSVTTGKVYASITDSDENTNAAVAETVSVTMQSAATGDQETLVLAETGVNTGIFTNQATGLVFDADDIALLGNGTLETRDADTVTLSYTDNDDASDTSSATAVVKASEELIIATLVAAPENIRLGEIVTFTGTIQNLTSESLDNFRIITKLPLGLIFQPGTARVSSQSVSSEVSSNLVTIPNLDPLLAGATRTFAFTAIAGTATQPGSYPVQLHAQFNPIISNTAQVTLMIRPDPIFHVGTLIGKVFWDINKNGAQDDGEIGIPNAVIATEQGYVITTDQYGRYHIPDFLSGRHMIKIDRGSLPEGSRLTTPEAVVLPQTDGMMSKVNFGVIVPEKYAAQYDQERESDVTLLLRKDTQSPKKSFALEFHDIRPAKDLKTKKDKRLLEQIQGGQYHTESAGKPPVLPFRLNMNYAKFVKSWSFELSRYELSDEPDLFSKDLKKRKREVLEIAKEQGEPTSAAFRYQWDLPLTESDEKIHYEIRVTLQDANGRQDIAVYDLVPRVTMDAIEWGLQQAEWKDGIPVKGTSVLMDGKTHANKIVSVYGKEDLTGSDGSFQSQIILPEGEQDVQVLLYLDANKKPVKVVRHVDLRDHYLFWVGFGESEWGKLNLRGNVLSVTAKDKSRFEGKWYNDNRVAYYLKGKIKGKYLITASLDTQREKRDLFRNLEPEDYYAVYGDNSHVSADANDTQDRYFLLLEVDKSYLKYGNFDTGFTGTELSDFNRTLHGGKFHYETLSAAPDGKPVLVLTLFTAKARQIAAYNEFKSTGGSLYYLKHKDVIRGSEKIKVVVRDKVSGISLSEKALANGRDYAIDYEEGHIRLYRPETTVTLESDSILSTQLLPGNPQHLVVEYEYEARDFVGDRSQGFRATHSFLDDRVRLGGTYVEEERSLKRFTLEGLDASFHLPLQTNITVEGADSSLQATSEFVSNNGGLTFTEIQHTLNDGSGQAFTSAIETSPWSGVKIAAYYRTLDPGFSSSGTVNEAGSKRQGVSFEQALGRFGSVALKHESEKLLQGANPASQLPDPTAGNEQVTDSAQYKLQGNRWEAIAEYKNAQQQDKTEKLAGLEGRYDLNAKTKVSLTGQKSLGSTPNDQVRAGLVHKITENFSFMMTQAFGTAGLGSLFGLQSNLLGQNHDISKGFGSLKEDKQKAEADTEIGFSKKISKDTEVKFGEKVGGKKARVMHLTRTAEDGRVLEMVRETSEDSETSSYSETEQITPEISKYSQSSVTEDKRTRAKTETETRGFKMDLWNGRGSLYQEDHSSRSQESSREGSKKGVEIPVGEYGRVDASYESNGEVTGNTKKNTHTGKIAYDYFEYDRLRFHDDWELNFADEAQDTLRLVSTGKGEWFLNPEWTVLGRYEWSSTENQTLKTKVAFFSELQTGFAYRPIDNDKLNMFGEWKFLQDEAPTGQFDKDSEEYSRRQILRGEVAYDLFPRVTFSEKLAIRHVESAIKGAGVLDSLSYLAGQRINYHVTDRFDIIGEYRLLGQGLAKDATSAMLLEGTYRLTDALRVSVGYNAAKYDSQLSADLNVETSGLYVRLFYDALEEVRGIMRKKREKAGTVAQRLEKELERVHSIPGREKDIQEMKSRLVYAHELMEKQLYVEAIEVLQQGLQKAVSARLYVDRAHKRKAQFDFYFSQGKLLYDNELYDLAFRNLEKAYRINAFHEGLLDLMSKTRSEILRLLRIKRRIRNEQIQEFEKLKEIQEPGELIYRTIHMHYVTGMKYFKEGIYEAAIKEWEEGLELAKKVQGDRAIMTAERKGLLRQLRQVHQKAKKYYDTAEYGKAREEVRQALELLREIR